MLVDLIHQSKVFMPMKHLNFIHSDTLNFTQVPVGQAIFNDKMYGAKYAVPTGPEDRGDFLPTQASIPLG